MRLHNLDGTPEVHRLPAPEQRVESVEPEQLLAVVQYWRSRAGYYREQARARNTSGALGAMLLMAAFVAGGVTYALLLRWLA
jgi:type IV secretory pathway TrbF-like protein